MINSHDLAIFFMLTTGGLFMTSVGLAVAWIRARERAYRAEVTIRANSGALTADDAAHLQRTVDSVALEVERIGEAQRFLTRVLSTPGSRAGEPRLGEPGRVITPH